MPVAATLDPLARRFAANILDGKPPPRRDAVLRALKRCSDPLRGALQGFAAHVGVEAAEAHALADAYLFLVATQLGELGLAAEQGDAAARNALAAFDRDLADLVDTGGIPGEALPHISGVMRAARVAPGSAFAAAHQAVVDAAAPALGVERDLLAKLIEGFRSAGDDPFPILQAFGNASFAMPAAFRPFLAEQMLASGLRSRSRPRRSLRSMPMRGRAARSRLAFSPMPVPCRRARCGG
jgi:hypothetical protein